jgi:hypothetical protein
MPLSDREDPSWKQSNTDREAPMLANPITDTEAPIRAKVLTDRELPTIPQSRRATAAPSFDHPTSDNDDPQRK